METTQKQQIVETLISYCLRYSSDGGIKDKGQNKAANSLKNVSSATISHMIGGTWDLISDEMWRQVGVQIGHKFVKWNYAETSVSRRLKTVIADHKDNHGVSSIIGDAGIGKTEFLKIFEKEQYAYLLKCSDYWNKKQLCIELLHALGKEPDGKNINRMMQEIISTLKSQPDPIIMIDEVDKLSDDLLYFFITLYNELEDYCSIIMASTSYFQKRIEDGRTKNKKGFREIWSRLGKKFIELNGLTAADITAVCMANEITDNKTISEIIEDSEGDLRRVKKKCQAFQRSMKRPPNPLKGE